MVALSVIIITKNQAWNIVRLIESVLAEIGELPSAEVVLVDSASTDATVDLARPYPIGIMQLPATSPLTPAAGRYVGYRHTTGRAVLFLDGDMELYPGWLARARRLLDADPAVGVVTGSLIDLPKTAGPADKPPPVAETAAEIERVPACGGAGLYRRAVLEAVGPFNPFLYSDEEPELCIRIRHRGYAVMRLQYPIAFHYSDPDEALLTLIRRWRRNLYLGAGQNIRYHWQDEYLWPYVRERGFGLIPLAGTIAGVAAVTWSARTGNRTLPAVLVLATVAALAGDAYRKRSAHRTLHSLLKRALIAEGTVRGALLPPRAASDYPADQTVIQPPVVLPI
jgi:glycosyltransferase involved in cell wall biosynthesis